MIFESYIKESGSVTGSNPPGNVWEEASQVTCISSLRGLYCIGSKYLYPTASQRKKFQT